MVSTKFNLPREFLEFLIVILVFVLFFVGEIDCLSNAPKHSTKIQFGSDPKAG